MRHSLARLLGALSAVLFACLGVLTCAAPAQADDRIDTTLTMQATMSADRIVTGSGVLQARNAVVPNMTIMIVLDGYTVQTVVTNAQGLYAFNFAMSATTPGDHKLTAQFPGDPNSLKPSEASAVIRLPDAPAAQLTGSIDPTVTVPGSLVTVTGKLANSGGTPVANALVSFELNKQQQRESTTSTVADGTFTSIVVLPDDAQGKQTITATFAGNAGAGPAAASWTVTAAAEHETTKPSPAAASAPSLAATVTATPTSAPSAIASAAVATSDSPSGPPWLLIGIAGFTLFGTLVAVGIVYRDRIGRSRDRSGSELLDRFIGDDTPAPPDSASSGPRRAAD